MNSRLYSPKKLRRLIISSDLDNIKLIFSSISSVRTYKNMYLIPIFFPAINSPTVPVGEETLRLAPTPHHTKEMMDQFANDLLKVWIDLGLELKPRNAERRQCPQSGEFCVFCEKPMIFEQMEARTRECPVPNCPQITATA